MNMFRFFQVGAVALGLSSCVPVPVGGHGGYGHHGYGHGGYGGYGSGRQVLVPTGQRVLVPSGYGHGGYGHGGYGYSESRGIQPCDPRYYQPGRQYYYQPPPVTIPPAHYGYGGYGGRRW